MRILSANGRFTTSLPRKGCLMLVKFNRSGVVSTRDVAPAVQPLDELQRRLDEGVGRFRQEVVTPQSFCTFEDELETMAREFCRQVLEQETNCLEAADKSERPGKVRYHRQTYRLNKRTTAQIATRFGTITLRSFYYLAAEDGEPGLHPLHVRLGIGAGAATPGLLERVARMAVDHT